MTPESSRLRLAKSFLLEATRMLDCSKQDFSKGLSWHDRMMYWQRCYDNLRQELQQIRSASN